MHVCVCVITHNKSYGTTYMSINVTTRSLQLLTVLEQSQRKPLTHSPTQWPAVTCNRCACKRYFFSAASHTFWPFPPRLCHYSGYRGLAVASWAEPKHIPVMDAVFSQRSPVVTKKNENGGTCLYIHEAWIPLCTFSSPQGEPGPEGLRGLPGLVGPQVGSILATTSAVNLYVPFVSCTCILWHAKICIVN